MLHAIMSLGISETIFYKFSADNTNSSCHQYNAGIANDNPAPQDVTL
jgi:hypothetical protein